MNSSDINRPAGPAETGRGAAGSKQPGAANGNRQLEYQVTSDSRPTDRHASAAVTGCRLSSMRYRDRIARYERLRAQDVAAPEPLN